MGKRKKHKVQNSSTQWQNIPKGPSGRELRNKLSKFRLPIVIFTQTAWEKIELTVAHCTKEVGWIGLVDKVGEDYMVVDIEVPEQEVDGSTCEISEGANAKAFDALFDRNEELFPNAYIGHWGHSHVNMGVSPSAQDIDTAMEREDTEAEWIYTIHNKKGNVNVDLYDFKNRKWLDGLDYEVLSEYTPEQMAFIQTLDERVKDLPKPTYNYSKPAGNVYRTAGGRVIESYNSAYAGGPTFHNNYGKDDTEDEDDWWNQRVPVQKQLTYDDYEEDDYNWMNDSGYLKGNN